MKLDIDIYRFMRALSEVRPVFHSEADFQHAFAWALYQQWLGAQVRLELPITVESSVLHLDVWVVIEAQPLAIELKYKTALLDAQIREERFHLRNHSVQDIGRYDFIQDIERLELITTANPQCNGWAIMLTNEAQYWRPRPGGHTVDSAFRLAEGCTLQGELAWGSGASPGTMRSRERPLSLHGTYQVNWKPYSHEQSVSNGEFRYLALPVVPVPGVTGKLPAPGRRTLEAHG